VAQHGIKALVIACNTATAAAVHLVRAENPALPVVGVEPALKPALALTRTGRIGVMATRGTLESRKFRTLLHSVTAQAKFVLQPCDGLADAIESHDGARAQALCEQHMKGLGAFGNREGEIDTLVLGCTHYPFAQEALRALAGPLVQMIDTGEPVARQTRRLLEAGNLLAPDGQEGMLLLLGTGNPAALEAAAQRWLDVQAA
jgi:glutamate racemase